MFQFKPVITEDTFTPWAENKLVHLTDLEFSLLETLGELFLEETDPYVPVWSGSLEKSAHKLWVFVPALESMNLQITWSGMFNPNQWEFEAFDNSDREDYALPNYGGIHWKTADDQPMHHWIDQGLWYFDSMVNDILKREFLPWLFK